RQGDERVADVERVGGGGETKDTQFIGGADEFPVLVDAGSIYRDACFVENPDVLSNYITQLSICSNDGKNSFPLSSYYLSG
ncbi:MAG: hypothetical protein GY869_05225, partial [Planctomycetes bacterium]|nr:hypothetical protein [Planctomycetota bacterium]